MGFASMKQESLLGAGKMAQWVAVLAATPNHLNIPIRRQTIPTDL